MTPGDRIRHRYQIRFSITGRIRFLSHLEMVDTLLSALRRSGVRMALSEGMRPKPLIKVAMPRPVGVESWDEIVEVELADHIASSQFELQLSGTLPQGIALLGIEELEGRYSSAPSRVAGATFRVFVRGICDEDLEDALRQFRSALSVLVERRSPKKTRTVDVRAVVDDVTLMDGGSDDRALRFFARLTEAGSAKPDEVVQAVASFTSSPITVSRVVRESVTLSQTGSDGVVADAALVGADVPDGPQRPWGSC